MPTILFISKGESSASTRYRALYFFPYLQQAGWQPQHISAGRGLRARLAVLAAARQADVVVVLRKTFSPLYLGMLRRRAKYLVFDFDDAIFVRTNGEESRLRKQRFMRMMNVADEVWAGNHYLADTASQYHSKVSVLPTSIEPQRYRVEATKPDDTIDLVWIGSHSTRKYLVKLLPALERVAHDYPYLRLKIIADFDLPSEQLNTLAIPWSEENEAQALASSHIGIAPLIDNAWTRGKCALKILQYMAAGLPVIADEVGANSEAVDDGQTGLLVRDENGWLIALSDLIENTLRRSDMGEEGRKRVEKKYSFTNTAEKMLAQLKPRL